MCGISGVLAARGDALRVAKAMHAELAHRGPDCEGIEERGEMILCHRRLSIIDLSPAAAQPMSDTRGLVRISYNGEIYNYRELRAECERRGMEFRSTSDTEVLLNLFLLDGERAFARLNGMFAFCLTDERSGEAWLVRDHMGIKPLYWGESAHGIVFASELRAILRSGAMPFEVDHQALQAYAQLDFVPGPMSILRGVRKLPGGELLHVTREGRVSQRAFARAEEAPAERQDLDDVLRDSVARHLIADVPVGVFLSGGIDSSIIARVASDIAGRVSTFSIAFDDPAFDESRWFDMAARAIGSDHHTERLTSRTMLDLIPSVAETISEPLADSSIFPMILLSRFARRHVKVALSGDGADELFAGYLMHRMIGAGRTAALLPRSVRRGVSAAAHAVLHAAHANLSIDSRVRKFLEGADRDPVAQNEHWRGSFAADDLPKLLTSFDAGAQRRLVALWHEPSRGIDDPLERVLRTDQRFYLQDQVLAKVDRASMASSLEVRVPMLDREMVRFARALPRDQKLRGGRSKFILREWASRHFPQELWERPKSGFGAPMARFFRGELRELLCDTLSAESIARDGFFRPAAVQRLIADHQSGRRDERRRLFNVLIFTLWYRAFSPRPAATTT
jgi:asparagine synthase (glutamine-hydrolysing)